MDVRSEGPHRSRVRSPQLVATWKVGFNAESKPEALVNMEPAILLYELEQAVVKLGLTEVAGSS